MSYFASIHFPREASKGPARRLLAVGAGLLGLTLLARCSQGPPLPSNVPEEKAQATELQFDERYLDSLDGPQSARTQREMAIYHELSRLELAKRPMPYPLTRHDSVYNQSGDGPLIGYLNDSAQLADIYRKIDSLKVLEGIRVTPHK